MKRRNRNLAAVTMAATMACAGFARAGTVIGDWQGPQASSNDGWFDWTASGGGSSPTNNPGLDPGQNWPSQLYNPGTIGVTQGTQSLKMTAQSSYSQNLSLKTEFETDSQGNSELADFFNNTEITFQITYNAEEWSPNAGSITGLTMNAQGYGFDNWPTSYQFNSIGGPNYDTGNPGNPGNWDAKDYASPGTGGITTRIMTFSYANELPGGSGNPAAVSGSNPTGTVPANAGYVEFIMATITYDNSETLVPGNYYIGNATFTNAPVTTTWQAGQHPQGTSYNWGTISNFTPYSQATLTGGMPCNPGDTVNFGTNIPAGITETVDLNETQDFQISVGTMNFNNPGSSYLIDQGTGGGSLTLNGNVNNPTGTTTAGTATINDQAGNHTISAPVVLATNTTVSVGAANYQFTISGNISGTGGLTVSPTNVSAGTGTVALSGLNTYSGGTTVTSGVLEILPTSPLSKTGSALAKGAVTLSGSGLLQLATNVTSGSQSSPTPASNVNITSLSISGTGTLDINNNHIIIDYTPGNDPIASIVAWVDSGANVVAGVATWTGTGITSTAAAANAKSYGIGYADAADPGNPANLAAGQIEVMYTLLGDANLDGKVNGTDFNILATNFNTGGDTWDQGDFTYDGKVNGSDFNLLAQNFNQGATQAADEAALTAFASANGISPASVPEPASIALLTVGGLGILRRRRRGSN